jgi:hypothetical protein
MPDTLEYQLEKWKQLLLVFSGAGGVLLVAAIAELPLTFAAYQAMGRVLSVDPINGLSLVLFLACLPPGISLLAGRAWRALPLHRRQGPALGLLACAWAALAALDLRLLPLDLPAWLHLSVLGLGAVLAVAALALVRARHRAEELFP